MTPASVRERPPEATPYGYVQMAAPAVPVGIGPVEADGLVSVTTHCHGGCGQVYTSRVEPEWARAVELGGQCPACYERQEAARDMLDGEDAG